METKEVKLSFGTVKVRGITAGQAAKAADKQASIDRLYSKDVDKHAEMVSDLTFRILADCIVESDIKPVDDTQTSEGFIQMLKDSSPRDIDLLNKAIMELSIMPEKAKKKSSLSSEDLTSEVGPPTDKYSSTKSTSSKL